MNIPLDISSEHLLLIHQILRQSLSPKAHVWVFGSRATGTARKYSDLDLAIDNVGEPLSLKILATLSHEFDECVLPYKVDLVDYVSIQDDFRKKIDKEKILIE